ncbi:MAG: hypothetical protein WBF21_00505 [Steroidobacteraceae bacterium]
MIDQAIGARRMARRTVLAASLLAVVGATVARDTPVTVSRVADDSVRTVYLRVGAGDEGLLYEPISPDAKARVALILARPDGNSFGAPPAREMARRGYRVLALNHHGDFPEAEDFAQPLSQAIGYLHTLPGVERVVYLAHAGGGHLSAWYENVAEHGPAACQGPEKIYPCDGKRLTGLAKLDGIVFLDATLGAFHEMSSLDPAASGDKRLAALDMFSPANGYDPATGGAHYAEKFKKQFYAAQAARAADLLKQAGARLDLLKRGKGQFSDDEPLVVRGLGEEAAGARLYLADVSLVAHTKMPHTVLKVDGTETETIVTSVRPPLGRQYAGAVNTLRVMSQETTVRHFLTHSAIRLGADFAITEDDIVGVDWRSATSSLPANAEGIGVPTLILSGTCHYLVVPAEIVFDHLGSRDKTLAYVEGASHSFAPCGAEYGDTVRRAFDYVDAWLGNTQRF